ncbi:MAG: hypothetical protein GX660_05520 [Clostridiaceae bacterium]|nr:hypothetical protein [Clostridiaceae bacterium]
MKTYKMVIPIILTISIFFITACSKPDTSGKDSSQFNVTKESILESLEGISTVFDDGDGNLRNITLSRDAVKIKEVNSAVFTECANVLGIIEVTVPDIKKNLEGFFIVTYTFDGSWKIKNISENVKVNLK